MANLIPINDNKNYGYPYIFIGFMNLFVAVKRYAMIYFKEENRISNP